MKERLSLDDVCILISGDKQEVLFCHKLSVGANAFYHYGEKGLKPDILLAIHTEEYAGEEIMEFNGVRYAITRTYERPDGLVELTGTRKAGFNHAN